DAQNQDRQKLERRILAEARAQLAELDLDTTPALVLASEEWHAGIIGIVASRLVDLHARPVLMIALRRQRPADDGAAGAGWRSGGGGGGGGGRGRGGGGVGAAGGGGGGRRPLADPGRPPGGGGFRAPAGVPCPFPRAFLPPPPPPLPRRAAGAAAGHRR